MLISDTYLAETARSEDVVVPLVLQKVEVLSLLWHACVERVLAEQSDGFEDQQDSQKQRR